MTKANECTCPSGDGSLRHPCPAHPASVELAGVAANLTFINGRPAMCGCQVEYSSGGGEYSDVIYVTLCAKHSGSAILDLVATNRIALTPEYEGQWHADLYLDREIPLAKAEGATPAEAVLALMSAERIDPEQESVEQAGGDERAAFRPAQVISYRPGVGEVTIYVAGRVPGYMNIGDTVYVSDRAPVEQPSAALAQPSPAQAEQAEAERPEVVARVMHSNPVALDQCAPLNANDELMTVAQHAASVARWAEMFNRVEQERDAALSRVAELEKQEPSGWLAYYFGGKRNGKIYGGPCGTKEEIDRYIQHVERSDDSISLQGKPFYAAPVAQAQHSVPEGWMLVPVEPLLNMMSDKDHDTRITAERQLLSILAAAPGKEVGHE
ncbi:hypothetical protein [Pseudomonas aeruginosa]|uniref:hypothetical protein n=1 Tax=Pseudomonas aeruginosa TaxID=287 RepID=UPI0025B1732B|nr:hypothetical protein [Pseudomonas aeruginosa]MDN2475156.1 hypothetical protein [Pseudomonas aeruginosa]MDN2554108.1 hypothetical protein [Pseudomonas aeruginosa]MDN2559728.1 hypothetical protein [Pseudomonas aeruginosa]MDN2573167.1 hypothetical protein [Pseudomonas aeruginosa]HBO5242080.1 hypothetical protein [Pseudomonas aeruginosa]